MTQHGQVGQPGGPSVRVRLPGHVRVQTASGVRPGRSIIIEILAKRNAVIHLVTDKVFVNSPIESLYKSKYV